MPMLIVAIYGVCGVLTWLTYTKVFEIDWDDSDVKPIDVLAFLGTIFWPLSIVGYGVYLIIGIMNKILEVSGTKPFWTALEPIKVIKAIHNFLYATKKETKPKVYNFK